MFDLGYLGYGDVVYSEVGKAFAEALEDSKDFISEECLRLAERIVDSVLVNEGTSRLKRLMDEKSFPTLHRFMAKVSSPMNVATFTYEDVNASVLETILKSSDWFPVAIAAIACDISCSTAHKIGRKAITTLGSEAGQYVMGYAPRL